MACTMPPSMVSRPEFTRMVSLWMALLPVARKILRWFLQKTIITVCTALPRRTFFDADYVKLREVSLTYQLPVKFVRKFHLQDASVALTARNLWTIHKDAKDIDPEAAISSGNAQGVEAYTLPTTRQIGINLNVKF